MKRHEIVYTKRALRDLDAISDKVTAATSSRVADRYRERILAACSRIGDAPEAGRIRPDIQAHLRSWPFERRLISLYRVDAKPVRIARIFDGRRDYPRLFGKGRIS